MPAGAGAKVNARIAARERQVFQESSIRLLVIAMAASLAAPAAWSQTRPLPPNTVSCDGFTRNPDGTWTAGANTKPFSVAPGIKNMLVRNSNIKPRVFVFGGMDLHRALEEKCRADAGQGR